MEDPIYPIVFSYDEDEHIPVLLGWGHNLKHENMGNFTLSLAIENENRTISRKGKLRDIEAEIKIFHRTDNNDKVSFDTGVLTMNEKQFPIKMYAIYNSLQIENYCYDYIAVVKLTENPFQ